MGNMAKKPTQRGLHLQSESILNSSLQLIPLPIGVECGVREKAETTPG